MTPPHGTQLSDSGEREAARNAEDAHMHRCESEDGGPVFEMKKDIKAINENVSKVMQRQAAWNGGALVLQIIGMAVFGAWLSSKFSQPSQHANKPSPTLINSAHAETKVTP